MQVAPVNRSKALMMKTRTPIKRYGGKRQRAGLVDKDYLAWIASQPCMVSGRRPTVHHVRRFGGYRDDRRTVPLAPEYHLYQHGPKTSIEALGVEEFERRYNVDLEAAI